MPVEIRARVEGDKAVYRDLQRASSPALHRLAWGKVRSVSLALLRRIKTEMPVDTGRARASWGQWTPADVRAPNPDASEEDAVWEEKQGDLTVTQGSNVPYIAPLNEGHSQQAPAGFIDRAAMTAAQELVKEIDELLGRLFR